MPFHAHSLFTAGPRCPFSRDERRIWRALIEMHRRAGNLTALQCLVAYALLRRLGIDGRCDPSHATLADDAGCCVRTVGETLRRMKRLGLASWLRRIVRRGSKVAQTSNAYRLAFTEPPVSKRKPKVSSSMAPLAVATIQPDEWANAQRQIAIAAQQQQEWLAQRTRTFTERVTA